MKRLKGFTLIELLIVIAVIAVLVAILVPNFKSMRMEAKESKARGDLKNIQTAVVLYVNKYGYFPTTDGTVGGLSLNALLSVPKEFRAINNIPDDPFRSPGSKYSFLTSTGAGGSTLDSDGTYAIFSYGRDELVDITQANLNTAATNDQPITSTDDDIFVTNAKE